MKSTLTRLAALVVLGAGVAAVQAQPSMSASTPKGEKSTPNQDKGSRPHGASVESRANTRNEAATDNKAGETRTGEKSVKNQDRGMGASPKVQGGSAESRSDVKSEAATMNKSGDIPKGQKSTKDQDKGGMKQ
jgi:hypothetical protein